ncbi:MAG TPA: YraN family protein [Burkholderiaceae bacterium]|nr:YraN family protein [Burkholderiaceae bacterium]
MSATLRQRLGALAEQRAEAFLQARGLQPIARNVRFRGGEIDLVMRDADEVVFVEVRARASRGWGGAAASIDARKRRRLRLAAQLYLLQQHGNGHWPACRFDVVAIDADSVDWIRGAFGSG